MKRYAIIPLIIVFLCSCQVDKLFIRVIHHPRPDLKAKPLPVQDLVQSSQLASVCPSIEPANDLWGGLQPVYPMAECSIELAISVKATTEPPHLFMTGCALRTIHSLVIFKDGTYQNLDQFEELQAVFAPIESADEALSYAMLATGYYPLYGQTVNKELDYFQRTLEDTFVEETQEGWKVRLFFYRLCGCSEHYVNVVNALVTRAGDISLGEPVPVSEDPKLRLTCVD